MTPLSPAARSQVWAALAITCVACGWLAPIPGLSSNEQRALGVTLFALIMWTAQPVSVEVSSFAVLLLLPATGLLSLAEAFAPFAGPTIWLVFAGMVLSLLLTETGLGTRLADTALPWFAGGGCLRLLIGLHVLGLAAAFLVPSGVVRVLLLMPVGIALCRRVDPDAHDPILPVAVTLSIVCGTYFGGCAVLTGSVPNLVVAGQLQAETGRIIYWGEWLVWMFPVIGVLRTMLCVAVIWWLWGRRMQPLRIMDDGATGTPTLGLSSDQRNTLLLLLCGVALWATDVIHGLAPVFVGLCLVLTAVLPRWGPLPAQRLRDVNFPFFFYIAALFGVGEILDVTGFNARTVQAVIGALPDAHGHWFGEHLTLTLATLPLDFLMDIAAVAAVATPSLLSAGADAGLSPLASAMSVAMATTVAFLPYQAAPFMVTLGFGTVQARDLSLAMLLISTLSVTILCPLNLLYWRALGLI
ncbi:MAG: SLC13 family permease [bacterium]|nr:SLC13 family permease [bacterium]